ncbi:MAG: hypothetical protein AB7V77_01110 [Candidatus Woesearchaeota archaeon]
MSLENKLNDWTFTESQKFKKTIKYLNENIKKFKVSPELLQFLKLYNDDNKFSSASNLVKKVAFQTKSIETINEISSLILNNQNNKDVFRRTNGHYIFNLIENCLEFKVDKKTMNDLVKTISLYVNTNYSYSEFNSLFYNVSEKSELDNLLSILQEKNIFELISSSKNFSKQYISHILSSMIKNNFGKKLILKTADVLNKYDSSLFDSIEKIYANFSNYEEDITEFVNFLDFWKEKPKSKNLINLLSEKASHRLEMTTLTKLLQDDDVVNMLDSFNNTNSNSYLNDFLSSVKKEMNKEQTIELGTTLLQYHGAWNYDAVRKELYASTNKYVLNLTKFFKDEIIISFLEPFSEKIYSQTNILNAIDNLANTIGNNYSVDTCINITKVLKLYSKNTRGYGDLLNFLKDINGEIREKFDLDEMFKIFAEPEVEKFFSHYADSKKVSAIMDIIKYSVDKNITLETLKSMQIYKWNSGSKTFLDSIKSSSLLNDKNKLLHVVKTYQKEIVLNLFDLYKGKPQENDFLDVIKKVVLIEDEKLFSKFVNSLYEARNVNLMNTLNFSILNDLQNYFQDKNLFSNLDFNNYEKISKAYQVVQGMTQDKAIEIKQQAKEGFYNSLNEKVKLGKTVQEKLKIINSWSNKIYNSILQNPDGYTYVVAK